MSSQVTINEATSEVFGNVIFAYTRRQAIEDGLLVQLSGPGYEGDQWMPKMVAEAGIRIPVAMTVEVFNECVSPTDDSHTLAPCQDIEGRLWDVLWMLASNVRATRGNASELTYTMRVVPNIPTGSKRTPRPKKVILKAVIGGDDDGSPCITIMYPHQD